MVFPRFVSKVMFIFSSDHWGLLSFHQSNGGMPMYTYVYSSTSWHATPQRLHWQRSEHMDLFLYDFQIFLTVTKTLKECHLQTGGEVMQAVYIWLCLQIMWLYKKGVKSWLEYSGRSSAVASGPFIRKYVYIWSSLFISTPSPFTSNLFSNTLQACANSHN
jgi:hypothetical protein